MISSEMRLHILRRVAACAAIAGGVLVGQMPATAGAQELTAAVRFEAVPDPHFLWSAATGMFYRHYLATVMNLDSKDQPALGLAESFKVDPSSLVWEFRLRPDLKFANGTPITAGDIVASFERARTMPNAAEGSHPEGTDVSALDHILGDHATISEERGLFLPETWRLHPTICSFTSEMFYEGRLFSRPGVPAEN